MKKSDIKIYEYLPDSSDIKSYGIAINKNELEVGNINDLNNFTSFKLDNNIKDNLFNDDKEYIYICLSPIIDNGDEIENIIDLICIEHDKNINNTLVDILNNLSAKFSKISKKNCLKKYIGLFGELSFIYYLQLKNINIIDNYQTNNDLFDFHFNSFDFEIKFLSKLSSTITLSDRQLNWVHKQKNNHVIAINIEQNSIMGINLYQLFNKIKFNNCDPKKYLNILSKINNLKIESEELFTELKYDISTLSLVVINNEELPYIEFKKIGIEKSNIISSAKFKIFVNYWQDNGEKINNIIELIKNEK